MNFRLIAIATISILISGCGEKTYEIDGVPVTAQECRHDAEFVAAEAHDQELLQEFLEGRGDLHDKTAIGTVGPCGHAAHAAFLDYRSANDQAEPGRLRKILNQPDGSDPVHQAEAESNESAARAKFEQELATLYTRAQMKP